MSVKRPAVLYLHGFNSSPDSLKARQFKEFCHSNAAGNVIMPALPYDPAKAIAMLQALLEQADQNIVLIVGSSLGGFYATWLSEKYGIKAVLINPAVAPCERLGESFLGWHKNYYSGEEYEFTHEYAEVLRSLTITHISQPDNFLVFLQTGDKVLDYRLAVELYAGSQQHVQQGGSHAFENFVAILPEISRFAGM